MNCHDFTTEIKTLFLEKLASLTPGNLNGIQMYCAGCESVEAAMRAARAHTKKYEFFSFYGDSGGIGIFRVSLGLRLCRVGRCRLYVIDGELLGGLLLGLFGDFEADVRLAVKGRLDAAIFGHVETQHAYHAHGLLVAPASEVLAYAGIRHHAVLVDVVAHPRNILPLS